MVKKDTYPPLYPHEFVEFITLASGRAVCIRPILPEDAPRLQATFQKLTPQTIYLRFLETFKYLSDKQANHFANVDYTSHMALVAVIQEDDDEQIIGVARYAWLKEQPGIAESAIVVRDDYQGQGLGTILMKRLVNFARTHGVKSFIATVHTSNARIRHFIQKSGVANKKIMLEPGVWEFLVYIDEDAEKEG